MSHKLLHHLKHERRRIGLHHTDIAYVLGIRPSTGISRYEEGEHLPMPSTALVYELIFGKPVSELFAGLLEALQRDFMRRALSRLKFLEKFEESAYLLLRKQVFSDASSMQRVRTPSFCGA